MSIHLVLCYIFYQMINYSLLFHIFCFKFYWIFFRGWFGLSGISRNFNNEGNYFLYLTYFLNKIYQPVLLGPSVVDPNQAEGQLKLLWLRLVWMCLVFIEHKILLSILSFTIIINNKLSENWKKNRKKNLLISVMRGLALV